MGCVHSEVSFDGKCDPQPLKDLDRKRVARLPKTVSRNLYVGFCFGDGKIRVYNDAREWKEERGPGAYRIEEEEDDGSIAGRTRI
ncbi:unnamed protein product [Sphagnum balticum]